MKARIVDRQRPEPLYHQLETLLRDRILSGEWARGEKIPTEDQLGEMYGVSRVTVRQALRNLVEDGYLERGQGRGTFVREPTLTAGERGLMSFSEEMRALGLSPGAKQLESEVVAASQAVAGRLEIEPGQPVYRIRRLRTGDGKAIGLQTSFLSKARFPGLLEAVPEGASLYETLRSRYGLVLHEAHETFSVTSIPAAEAALLGVEPGASAFHVERVARDFERPFEYTVSLMRGDRYRIRWVLRNPDADGAGPQKEQ